MYLFCFICNFKVTELEKLFLHLKMYHSLKPNAIYKCGITNCIQQFTSICSFSKHMKSEINKPQSNVNNSTNIPMELKLSDIDLLPESNSLDMNDAHVPSINLQLLKDSALKFSLQYYGKPHFSRKLTTELQTDIIKLITEVISNEIETNIMIGNIDPHVKKSLETIIEFCKNPFIHIDTEYTFLKHLEEKELYEKPKIITLNNTVDNIVLNNINTIDEKKSKGVIFPLKFQLKKYFELPGVLDSFLSNHNSLNKDNIVYSNFLNCELWKQKMLLHPNKLVIPYFLYVDINFIC